jgi:CPA1 family monovalent cation:H+ antiporter
VIAAIEPMARRSGMPFTVALAIMGVVLGAGAQWLLSTPLTDAFNEAAEALVDVPIHSDTFLTVFLPLLLFQGAITIDLRRLAQDVAPVLLLAVLAVFVATAAIGMAVSAASGMPLAVGLLLGAIVATTDPSAVIALFREVGAPSRLTRLVEGESLLNDATAIAVFGALLAVVVAGVPLDLGRMVGELGVSFVGGAAFGAGAGVLAAEMIARLRSYRAAQLTVAAALPYVVYLMGRDLLLISGVVAVVTAGLALGALLRSRLEPATIGLFQNVLDQLAYWAGGLVFVFAALLVPRLMQDFSLTDLGVLAAAVGAGLAARALTIFTALPALALLGLTRKVNAPTKAVIVWGGLRGAVTLALALAVTENPFVAPEVKRFIAINATGFALFTLLAQGLTLRSLIRWLKLDQLSPVERAFRQQVLGQALSGVRSSLRQFAGRYGLSNEMVDQVMAPFTSRLSRATEDRSFLHGVSDRERLTVGLITLANHERSLVTQERWSGGLPRPLVDRHLRAVEAMIDGAREDGRLGYIRASRRVQRPTMLFVMAARLHARARIGRPLALMLESRFQLLLLSRIMVLELQLFLEFRLAVVLGDRLTDILAEILRQRLDETERQLEALRLQYPAFAQALDYDILERFAWREELDQIEQMREAGIIGGDMARSLSLETAAAHAARPRRGGVDLRLPGPELLRSFEVFEDLDPAALKRLAKSMRLRVFAANARVVRRGERLSGVYFIASGAIELRGAGEPERLGRGDWLGEDDLMEPRGQRREAVSLSYAHLLFLSEAQIAAEAPNWRVHAASLAAAARAREKAEAEARAEEEARRRAEAARASARAEAPRERDAAADADAPPARPDAAADAEDADAAADSRPAPARAAG